MISGFRFQNSKDMNILRVFSQHKILHKTIVEINATILNTNILASHYNTSHLPQPHKSTIMHSCKISISSISRLQQKSLHCMQFACSDKSSWHIYKNLVGIVKLTVPLILSCGLKTGKYYNRNRFIVSSAKDYNQGATRLDPHENLISKCRNLLNSIDIANFNMYFEKSTLVLYHLDNGWHYFEESHAEVM